MDALLHPTHPAYYANYFDRLEGPWRSALTRQAEALAQWPSLLTEAQGDHAYAPGKWSVKQLIGHVADSERIFAYRALSIARGEQQNLPGFEEDDYVRAAAFERRSLRSVLAELTTARAATLALLEGLDAEALGRTGHANGKPVSVEALMAVTAAHHAHHTRILAERYGIVLPL